MEDDKLLTVKEVAKTLRVTPRTVFNYIDDGRLKSIKPGRKVLIRQSELENFIKENERG